MGFDGVVGHYHSVVVKVHNEQHLFGSGDFSNHFAVSPLLAGFVGVLEQRGSQQVPDLGLGHSYLYLIDLPGGAGRNSSSFSSFYFLWAAFLSTLFQVQS